MFMFNLLLSGPDVPRPDLVHHWSFNWWTLKRNFAWSRTKPNKVFQGAWRNGESLFSIWTGKERLNWPFHYRFIWWSQCSWWKSFMRSFLTKTAEAFSPENFAKRWKKHPTMIWFAFRSIFFCLTLFSLLWLYLWVYINNLIFRLAYVHQLHENIRKPTLVFWNKYTSL